MLYPDRTADMSFSLDHPVSGASPDRLIPLQRGTLLRIPLDDLKEQKFVLMLRDPRSMKAAVLSTRVNRSGCKWSRVVTGGVYRRSFGGEARCVRRSMP